MKKQQLKIKTKISITGDLGAFKDVKRLFEVGYVTKAVLEAGGNISRAAEIAGKERKDFYDLMRRCGVTPEQARRS